MKSKGKKLIVILGPNASGKSNFGVFLAKKLRGEIISADSRQVYKGLDIGSGKITKKEMKGIPHHCLDIANPKKVFTAYDYKKGAQKAIREIWNKGKTPIIVGGTGFYIDAVIGRVVLSNIPPNPKLRKKLLNYSSTKLFNLLEKFDPKKAEDIDKNNPTRLIRAIEIASSDQTEFGSICDPNSVWDKMPKILWIGVKRSPEDLKKRIRNRLHWRLQGITKEVSNLHKMGLSWKRLFDLGLEYRYVSLYLRKKLNYKEMVQKLETEVNKYAKRQMTYWKRNKEIHWVSSKKEAKKLGQRFLLA